MIIDAHKVAEASNWITSIDVDFFDPFHVFLSGNNHGLINVYKRKNFQVNDELIIQQQLKRVNEIQYYKIDEYKFNRKN